MLPEPDLLNTETGSVRGPHASSRSRRARQPWTEEEMPMITVLAFVTLAAVHGAVLAANTRFRRAVPARSPRIRIGAGDPALAAPVDLAEYRRKRSGRHGA